ncbi:endonuclease/exonuclease/phosphatase family protein [Gynurincola endophyticus]|uniref:endonuclease/exonuclease/phosphatase family protein n=1 Tax=Gynurincola endophyticus TaxID=2479004 RepID=UPI000F8C30EC|nr:endonuclease/exonuclease/phosphatase family protein [Gynurincola endophyticus]
MLIRKITKKVLIISNISVAVLFLLALTNSFIPPYNWWPIAMLGIAFPIFLILQLLFLILWVSYRSKWFILPLFSLMLGYQHIAALIAFNLPPNKEVVRTDSNTVSVLSWNVRWFDKQKRNDRDEVKDYRESMLALIKEIDADVLCFQEFLEQPKDIEHSNVEALKKIGYKYYHRVIDYGSTERNTEVGVAIFSKYPFFNTTRLRYPGTVKERAAESLISVDLVKKKDTIRIFNTHLQSILLNNEDYENLQKMMSANESVINNSMPIFRKLRTGYKFRSQQAEIVSETLNASDYPAIVCGDFNDVPNSYTYFKIKGEHKDAFVEKGTFIGRTYRELGITLRIDYLICDPAFEVLAYERFRVPYSDHYPIKAVFKIP